MLLEGLQLGRRYNLRTLIGRGMGEVYLAEDTRINNRQVVVKVARSDTVSYPDAEATKDAARLFQREMIAIGMLNHPNILPLFDSGEDAVNSMPLTYLVMPYCPDGSLATWLRQRSGSFTLSPQDVAAIVSQAADALQFAHDRQIVHRDVKPSNFLIRNNPGNPNRPNVLLTDFGIAKFIATTVTASQTVRGTPAYMAPEQWTGQPVPATDQYALAAMAYELLTGRPVFQASMEQMLYLHLTAQPQPPSSINPRLPRALDAVLLRALAKRPEERFPSITAFAQAFQQAAVAQPLPNPPTPTPPPPSYPGKDISLPLVISREEAMTGTHRVVPLPGGRQVNVFVPQGAYNGQMLHLPGMGEQPPYGGPPGNLVLTLTVPNVQSQTTNIPVNPPGPAPFPVRTILLVGLVLLLILASVAGFFVIKNGQTTTDNQNATATANINATGTTQAANTNATATAQANSATATVQANATATARVAPTATVIAANPYPSYLPGNGTLAFYDPLSQPYQWGNASNSSFGGACQFTNGAYQISQSKTARFYYCTTSSNFSNFAFEVQMRITQGDCGGMVFRANNSSSSLYFFEVCQTGVYKLIKYVDNTGTNAKTLISDLSLDITTGLNVSNLIAVVASGSTLELYVNNQKIASTSDGSYSQGEVGLVAGSFSNPTQVAYKNAKVWVL